MSQLELDFKSKREITKKRLTHVAVVVQEMLERWPEFREIKNINNLVRHVWSITGMDISCESIARAARKIRAEHPELDTESNQNERANLEVAYREHNQNS